MAERLKQCKNCTKWKRVGEHSEWPTIAGACEHNILVANMPGCDFRFDEDICRFLHNDDAYEDIGRDHIDEEEMEK